MVQSLATLPLKRRRSLGFVLVLPVPEDQAKRKRARSVPKRAQPRNCKKELFSDSSFQLVLFALLLLNRECLEETKTVFQEISSKEKKLKNTSRYPRWCYHDKTLLWTQGREEKNWYKKVKEEGRTCQELLRCWKKAVFWQEKKETYLQKPKKSKLKRPKPKINCSPP